jgi:hypothetical protein
MSKRLLALMLVGVVSLAGLALAQDPPAHDEPPVRLKKKKPRNDDKPMVGLDKPDEKKTEDQPKEKKESKKTEPREAEPVTPQEEEKEVLQRVVQNVHRVGERLAKNDLGEATQQTQRDILKDLESLIQRNENPPPSGGGGGGGGGSQQNQNNNKNNGNAQSGARTNNNKNNGNAQSGTRTSAGSQPRVQQQQRGGNKSDSQQRTGKERLGKEKGNSRNGINGNNGGGGDKDDQARKNADLDKHGVWGHLPQSLRAQMDAYSNPQPFMPKYDDLIKRYYRTISEQGRRKGE